VSKQQLVSGPWFEDFEPGADFSDVPSVTLTEGYAAIHQAITGDRLKLCLDQPLSRKVTGSMSTLANPSMVCNLAIGQSTIPSQRVLGNLFYRGLHFEQPVFIGDTLRTVTRVVGLRQNKKRPGRPASGMVVLEMEVFNQDENRILHFFRCPMIPCRDPDVTTDRQDDLNGYGSEISDDALISSIPGWKYDELAATTNLMDLPCRFLIEARDTVTLAPELVRLTLNQAMTHTDVGHSVYDRRLVYGGHTISIAAAQLSRAIPDLITILAWYHCDHLAPVFEGDILRTEVLLDKVTHADQCRIADLRIEVFASRDPVLEPKAEEVKVLDWRLAGLLP